jgi:hypothetical protein
MATSSIDSHVVIKDDKAAKRLIDAIEYADKHHSNIKPMTDEEMRENTKRVLDILQCKYRQSKK